jgi:histidinol phosphatase-like enzyme (inositol monophosphatase family)
MLSASDIKPFWDLANAMADRSGEVVRRYFRNSFAVEGKADASPVTVADREAEQVLRGILAAERPDDGLWGEEYGADRMEADFVWVLDPIDGTRAFACGKPLFGTLIALLYKGVPVLGVIDQPILHERWMGADAMGAYKNGSPCRTRRCPGIEAAVACLSPHPFPEGDLGEVPPYKTLAARVRTTSLGGDCYAYGLLASGFADLVVENNLKLHDYAALAPIVKNAGGTMTDWQGGALGLGSKGDVLAAGDARLAQAAMAVLQGAL